MISMNSTGSGSCQSPTQGETDKLLHPETLPMWLRLMNGRLPSSETRSDAAKLFLVQPSGSEAHVRGRPRSAWCPHFQLPPFPLVSAFTWRSHRGGLTGALASAMLITSKFTYARFKDSEVVGPGAGGRGPGPQEAQEPLCQRTPFQRTRGAVHRSHHQEHIYGI